MQIIRWRGADWALREKDSQLVAESYYGHLFSLDDRTNWIVSTSTENGRLIREIHTDPATLMLIVAEGQPIEPYLWSSKK